MEALWVVIHTASQPPGLMKHIISTTNVKDGERVQIWSYLPYSSCLAQWVGRNQPAWEPQVADGAEAADDDGALPGDAAAGGGQLADAVEAGQVGWVGSLAEEGKEVALLLLTPDFQPLQAELGSLLAPST